MLVKRLVTAGSAVAALLVMSACSHSPVEAEPVGDLSAIEVQSGSQSSGEAPFVAIGQARVLDPGTGVWDEPDGVTIGRLPAASFPAYATAGEWVQISYVNADWEPTLVWVPLSSVQLEVGD